MTDAIQAFDSLDFLASTYFGGDGQAAERWADELARVNQRSPYEFYQRIAALTFAGEAYPSKLPPYPFMVEWASLEGIRLPPL